MDAKRFNELARALGLSAERRGMMVGLLGGGLASLLASLESDARRRARRHNGEPGRVSAEKRKKHKKKQKKKNKLGPECPSDQILCDDLQCCERDLCTVEGCGCCPAAEPQCCGSSSTLTRFCHDPAAETCCPTVAEAEATACPQGTFCAPDSFDSYICCASSGIACGRGCCPKGTVCCYNEQADDHNCCPDETCQWWIGFNCTYAYEHIVYPRTF